MNTIYISLSILAVWRITHLFSKEDGPFDIIFTIRKKAGRRIFWKTAGLFLLLQCLGCFAFWYMDGYQLARKIIVLGCIVWCCVPAGAGYCKR